MPVNQLIQHSPPHPGAILQELYFEPLGLTLADAAQQLLISRPNLSAITNGRAGISPLMAVKLAKAFKTTPQYWMNLQGNYDLWQVLQQKKEVLRGIRFLGVEEGKSKRRRVRLAL